MKILYLAQRLPFPPNKGEKIRTFHQIQRLAQLGHRVDVAAPQEQEQDTLEGSKLAAITQGRVILSRKPGKASLFMGLIKGEPLSVSNFYSSELQQQIDQYLASHPVDAIVCTSSAMAAYVFKSKALGSLNKAPKLIMDFMDLDSDKWAQYAATAKPPMKWVYQREARLIGNYEARIYQRFQTSIFISQAEVDLLAKRIGNDEKFLVVSNGVNTQEFCPPSSRAAISAASLHMLFTGVMDYLPNEDAVCWFINDAWSQVKAKYPSATFTIVGMNPSKKVLQLADKPGVKVTGFVDDVIPYFNQANLFVAPFRLARGVQNKVLQAFACGLPTITTSMGIEGINAQHQENVLIANDIATILKAIDQLVSDPDKAATIGKNARALLEQDFSWESRLEPLCRIIETPQRTPE